MDSGIGETFSSSIPNIELCPRCLSWMMPAARERAFRSFEQLIESARVKDAARLSRIRKARPRK